MNPLLLLLGAAGLYYFATRSTEPAPIASGTIPDGTDTDASENSPKYLVISQSQGSRLFASPSGQAPRSFSFKGETVVVTPHKISASGQPYAQYSGYEKAYNTYDHYLTMIDSAELVDFLAGRRSTLLFYIVGGKTTAACAAFINFMRQSNPNLKFVTKDY